MKTLFEILNPWLNGFRHSSLAVKYTYSCALALLWCTAFSVIAAEMIYLGRSVVGHWMAVSLIFVTYMLFNQERKHSNPAPPNRCRWDLEREG